MSRWMFLVGYVFLFFCVIDFCHVAICLVWSLGVRFNFFLGTVARFTGLPGKLKVANFNRKVQKGSHGCMLLVVAPYNR